MESQGHKEELELLTVWYESYSKIVRSIGTISVTIIFFTSSFLLKDFLNGSFESHVNKAGIEAIKQSFLFFAISLFFVFACLMFTYNWYRSGIAHAMKNVKDSSLPDNFWYYKAWFSMKTSGTLSWVFGGLGAASLLIGIVIFVIRIIELFDLMV